jgi:lysozyme
MVMLRMLTAGLAFGLTLAASAGQDQEIWNDLTDQPSREELFQLVVKAYNEERAGLPPHVALPRPFLFPDHTTFDFELNRPRSDVLFGIDISHHNGTDLSLEFLAEQNVKFVYAKATQGVGFKDKRFGEHWRTLASLPAHQRVLRGAYHFLSAAQSGEAQAQSYLKFLKLHGGLQVTDMPPVVDLEWDVAKIGEPDRWRNKAPNEILASLLAWLVNVQQATGRIPMVYTARSWWRERMGSDALFSELAGYKVWIADYSESARGREVPRVPRGDKWHIWQFTDGAQLKRGYPRKLDANIFKGTNAEFEQEFQVKLR